MVNVQKTSQGYIVSDGNKIQGITYLSDAEVLNLMRNGEIDYYVLRDYAGNVLTRVPPEYWSDAEKASIAAQKPKYGINKNK